ncbi:hypothetical protein L2Y96_12415 [Luteibacter aegosomaticola]|uniref:hypothetical protein n=1 Tax=Luteibacter aegosomaticola TaxID=2911538 RepID=UPI001FF7FD0E|nr:hypothetical protein [Luteibacter aegosomaticola]UPG88223.1 hypothetical protein L2Y96_12415 [Luteibacter aegosomaticola]
MSPKLTPTQLLTLRQLADTAFLAVRTLDKTPCRDLQAHGLAYEDGDGWWRITEAGRLILDSLGPHDQAQHRA